MSREKEPLPTLGEICADVAAGSMVLARRVPVLTGRAWRLLVTFSEGAPEGGAAAKRDRKGNGKSSVKGRKKTAAKGDGKANSGGTSDDGEQPRSEGADEAAKAPSGDGTEKEPKAKERSGWDLLEQLGLGAFTVVVGYVFLHPYLAALLRALAPAALPIFATGVVLWIVAAYRAAPPNDHDKQREDGQGEEQQNAGPDPAEVRAAEHWLWLNVISRVQEAVAEGRRGVHLSTLLEEPGRFPPDWDVTRLREHCKRLGIPVKIMQIRGSKNRGPTYGVHVDELTAALGMPLAEAVYRFNVSDHRVDPTSDELPEAEHGTLEAPPAGPSDTPADAPRRAAESTAPPPAIKATATPSSGDRRPGLRARLHHPRRGAHSPPALTPSSAPARPSPEVHPHPLLKGDRRPGESPSTAPI
ncbi:hypothetical protein AB0912_15560 [Streptomyces sp. NPDC007084]|uniref:hypothetical protein n=1 Tax=Streptomyces sp. NPDC007084 TaxID=3154313 RepID=UPI003452997D